MYRPTVRYSDTYRDYINNLFHVSILDRNQILRLALHVAAHSPDFQQTVSKYKKSDAPLPAPNWKVGTIELWMENTEPIEVVQVNTPVKSKLEDNEFEKLSEKKQMVEASSRIQLKSNGGTISWSPFG